MYLHTHVWIANASVLADDRLFAQKQQTVSSARQKKIERKKLRKEQNLSLAAALLLNHGFDVLGIPPHLRATDTGEHGKPYLTDYPSVCFNLSHSGEYVLCAIGALPIGCDIEQIRSVRHDLYKRILAPEEYNRLCANTTEQAQKDAFFRFWTLKESYLKMQGDGLTRPMQSFTILTEPTIHASGDETAIFREYSLLLDYKISVCQKGGTLPLCLKTISLRNI